MSLQATKDHLMRLLTDPDSRVIALSGKWGTGKSHLWHEVQAASSDEAVRGALYVSLFGLSDTDQLKKKLLESVVPGAESNPSLWESAKQAVSSGVKILEGFHKSFAAISDLSLLLAPAMLKNKVIVIDDIERKHERLSIDEILGFIDQYSQQYGSRFVLILNSDQLAQKTAWDTLREKVIDQEIRLLTTPREAFEIAIKLTPSRYSVQMEKAVDTCGLTNIRIVRRVIRVANRVLGERELSDAVLMRIIPSIVLLTAINYKGIEDGPNFEFVLSIGSETDFANLVANAEKEPDDEDRRTARWRLLLDELNIGRCDEFEALVVQFLESGQFDASKIVTIVDRYAAETDKTNALEKAQQFLKCLRWDHRIQEANLVAQATELVPLAHLLDPHLITELDRDLESIADGHAVGQAMVQGWLTAFRTQHDGPHTIEDDSVFARPLHPDIGSEFDKIKARAQAKTTVFDACMHIIEQSGWGTMQEITMKTATVEDFESTIKGLSIDHFRPFMRRMIEMRIQRQSYDTHFGSATERFVEACRKIANDPKTGRLGTIIKRMFDGAKLGAELTIQVTPSSGAADTSTSQQS